MEEQEGTPQEEAVVEQSVVEETPVVEQESVEEMKQRLENAKAENSRKTQELQKLREELASRDTRQSEPSFNPQDLRTWKDHELKAVMKDPQYAALHDQAQELLTERRFNRFQAEREESLVRMQAELERKKNYPETLEPTHPMAIKMEEIRLQHRLDRTPAGYLVAAKLASSELKQQKALAAGRKQEQSRQADVKANFQGESSRPAPVKSDKVKIEELKKKAMAGDPEAKAEWFKYRGLA